VSNQQKEVIINFTPSRQAARRKNCFASLRLSEQPTKELIINFTPSRQAAKEEEYLCVSAPLRATNKRINY
jgi:hypothetical protein